jgi:formylglycine-generating enzyme required for sulfatase activity
LRREVTDPLLRWYRSDPDPGIHSAIDWLLRPDSEGPAPRALDWGQFDRLRKIDEELQRHDPDGKRRWYVNGQGQTLTVLRGPVDFRMGTPHTDPERAEAAERSHMRRIPRTFAVATKPVTVKQFKRFLKDRPQVRHAHVERYGPDPDGPILNVTWYEAALYCNWLSEKEGIAKEEWCYPDDVKDGMKPHPDYLRRKGYRLPTEAEWEYACRAGSETPRHFGNSNELLPRYAWFKGNSQDRSWPVGRKRPNDYGIFDMHGNVRTWTQDVAQPYPPMTGELPVEDREDVRPIEERTPRVARGGSFLDDPSLIRSPARHNALPSERDVFYGLRVARTCE